MLINLSDLPCSVSPPSDRFFGGDYPVQRRQAGRRLVYPQDEDPAAGVGGRALDAVQHDAQLCLC